MNVYILKSQLPKIEKHILALTRAQLTKCNTGCRIYMDIMTGGKLSSI